MEIVVILANSKSAAYVISNDGKKENILFAGKKLMHCHSNEDFEKFSRYILDGINYECYEKDIEVTVIDGCGNSKFREMFEEQLKNVDDKKFVDISEILTGMLKNLETNKSLEIQKYGANFDQRRFILRNGQLEINKFNLAAYTFTADDVVNYLAVAGK